MCPGCKTPEQYVTQLPDDLDHPTLQGSYCASPSLRAAAEPKPYVSFMARSAPALLSHYSHKGLPQTRYKPPRACHLGVFFFCLFLKSRLPEPPLCTNTSIMFLVSGEYQI